MHIKIIALLASALILFALASIVSVPVARAHAEIESCTPPIDGVVEHAPESLVCKTSEGMKSEGSSLKVFDAAGVQVDKGDSHVDLNDPDRKTISVSLDHAKMKDGVFTVEWTTVSADDNDEDSGEFKFTVGHAVQGEPTATPSAGSTPTVNARIAIVSPAEDAQVTAGPVEVKVTVEGVKLGEQYHWHLYLDNKELTMVMEGNDAFTINLPEGAHEIKVTLADASHDNLAEAHAHVMALAAVPAATPTTSAPGTLPAAGGDANGIGFTLFAIIGALVLGAGALVFMRARR